MEGVSNLYKGKEKKWRNQESRETLTMKKFLKRKEWGSDLRGETKLENFF